MDSWTRELHVARIISGIVQFEYNDRKYKIVFPPSREVRYFAQEVYRDSLREGFLFDLLSEEQIQEDLMEQGLWSEEEEELLSKLPKEIEEFKVKLFQNEFKSNQMEIIRKALNVARDKFNELAGKKQARSNLSASANAALAKHRYEITNCVFDCRSGQRMIDVLDEGDPFFMRSVEAYNKTVLPDEDLRLLARTEPWRSIWACRTHESSLLGISPADYTYEQRTLISWSALYESIYQHPECPSDDVIEDDDRLDGWMIIQRRNRGGNNPEAKITNPKIREAQEIFHVAETKQDADKIIEMNTPQARATMRKRFKLIEEKGTVNELEMPDTKARLYLEATNKIAERNRKK